MKKTLVLFMFIGVLVLQLGLLEASGTDFFHYPVKDRGIGSVELMSYSTGFSRILDATSFHHEVASVAHYTPHGDNRQLLVFYVGRPGYPTEILLEQNHSGVAGIAPDTRKASNYWIAYDGKLFHNDGLDADSVNDVQYIGGISGNNFNGSVCFENESPTGCFVSYSGAFAQLHVFSLGDDNWQTKNLPNIHQTITKADIYANKSVYYFLAQTSGNELYVYKSNDDGNTWHASGSVVSSRYIPYGADLNGDVLAVTFAPEFDKLMLTTFGRGDNNVYLIQTTENIGEVIASAPMLSYDNKDAVIVWIYNRQYNGDEEDAPPTLSFPFAVKSVVKFGNSGSIGVLPRNRNQSEIDAKVPGSGFITMSLGSSLRPADGLLVDRNLWKDSDLIYWNLYYTVDSPHGSIFTQKIGVDGVIRQIESDGKGGFWGHDFAGLAAVYNGYRR